MTANENEGASPYGQQYGQEPSYGRPAYQPGPAYGERPTYGEQPTTSYPTPQPAYGQYPAQDGYENNRQLNVIARSILINKELVNL